MNILDSWVRTAAAREGVSVSYMQSGIRVCWFKHGAPYCYYQVISHGFIQLADNWSTTQKPGWSSAGI